MGLKEDAVKAYESEVNKENERLGSKLQDLMKYILGVNIENSMSDSVEYDGIVFKIYPREMNFYNSEGRPVHYNLYVLDGRNDFEITSQQIITSLADLGKFLTEKGVK